MLPVAVARSSCDDNAIHYVLLVLRMTLRLHILDHMAHGPGNNHVSDILLQVVKISNVFTRVRHTG